MPAVTTPRTKEEITEFCKTLNELLGQESEAVAVWAEVIKYVSGNVPRTYLTTFDALSAPDKVVALQKSQQAQLLAQRNKTSFTAEFDKLI